MLAVAAAGGVMEARLLDALPRDVDNLLGVDIPERALLDRTGDRLLEGIPRQPDETLPVGMALPFGLSRRSTMFTASGLTGGLIPLCSRACTIRPGAGSAGRCSRG